VEILRAAGHKVDYQSCKEKKWHKILKDPGDVVAVAGGDGTVNKVARRLIGSPTPIAIIPMGTANNIATSLGIAERKPKNLVSAWKAARSVHFDAGVAKGPWGSTHFIEGFGLGLFAETMFQLEASNGKELAHANDPEEELHAVLDMLRGRLRKFKSSPVTVRLDGEDLSGQYVLLEALNVRFIGPNLNLAPEADTQDGFLDIVAVPYGKRDDLNKYLKERMNGAASALKSRRRQGRHLQIEWKGSPVHIDDMRWPDANKPLPVKSHAITIKVDPGALVFLAPPTRKQSSKKRA
jgi:diacylglycerol kinase (ATP)